MLSAFEILVAITALWVAVSARKGDARDLLSVTGYFSIALAATLGALRYMGYTQFTDEHRLTSFIATVVGVPFAAFGFFFASAQLRFRSVIVIAAIVIAPAIRFQGSAQYALLAGIAAQLIWLWGGWLHRHFSGHIPWRVVVSIALTSTAGLVFDGPGESFGMRRENIFHGLLALALWQQAAAFRQINHDLDEV